MLVVSMTTLNGMKINFSNLKQAGLFISDI